MGQPQSKLKEKRKKVGHRRQPGDELARDVVLLNVEEVQEVWCVCVCKRETRYVHCLLVTLGVSCMFLCMCRSGSITSS